MRYIISIVVLSILIPVSSANAESYLCIEELSVGFNYDKNTRKWKTANFHADDKYIVRRVNKSHSMSDSAEWVAQKHGVDSPIPMWCEKDFSEGGMLYCEDFFAATEFKMNKESLRFSRVNNYSYLTSRAGVEKEEESRPDSLSMTIGKCSRL